MSEPALVVHADPPDEAVHAVVRALVAYNATQARDEGWRQLLVDVHDDAGALLGGLAGSTFWGWLFVSHLWVREDQRGAGLGGRLLAAAEAEAVARGCRHAYLDTFSFQAPGFYEKAGYVPFGALEDYPVGTGHRRTFYVKMALDPA